MVSCSLPGVIPNTSIVTGVAIAAQDPMHTMHLMPSHPTMQLDDVSVAIEIAWKSFNDVQYPSVVGCQMSTPKFEVSVYQVSGWEEAHSHPKEHGWAAPFTWLNLGFHVHKQLAEPVTGLIGDTYPKAAAFGAATNEAAGSMLGMDRNEPLITKVSLGLHGRVLTSNNKENMLTASIAF